MKQCYHNEISKECAVLSDSERANFFSEFDATSNFKKLLVKPKISKPLKKRKVDEDVYQVERVLNVRKQKGKLEFEIKWMGYEETTWEPKTNLQGEACEFSLDCIFSVLHTYSSHYCFSARGNQFGRISESKREVCYFLLIDMIKLTIIPKFQNLIRKQKKQKNVPQVKAFDNLLILVSSK